MKNLDCKHCNSSIIKSYGDEAKMRAKLVKWTHKGMFAVWKGCGHENPIQADILKSLEKSFVYEVGEPVKRPKN